MRIAVLCLALLSFTSPLYSAVETTQVGKERIFLHAGYPYCKFVAAARTIDNREALYEALRKTGELDRLKEFYVVGEKTDFEKENEGASSLVPNRIEHPRKNAIPLPEEKTRSCFEKNTPISRLNEERTSVEVVTIYDINVGDYVLASTARMYGSAEFQRTCWDEVTELHAGRVRKGEPYVELQYGAKGGRGGGFLKVTPDHQFLAGEENPKWVQATKLEQKASLVGLNGTYFELGRVSRLTLPQLDFYDFASATYFHVFNLSTRTTHTYFVGSKGFEVLVHNGKLGGG